MRLSKLFFKTFKENPKEAESKNHSLLVKAGMIYQNANGIYSFMPLAQRVLKKIIKIVEEEMDKAGAQQLSLPLLTSANLWEQSGRWNVYGPELMRLEDRKGRKYALSPTAEESITDLVKNYVKSYKDLPINLYQITEKFRDEMRPRFGLMRAREFLMKDAYSFHKDEESLDKEFNNMKGAYKRILERLELNFKVCEADSGAIGGDNSFEFIVMTDAGEAEILYSDSGYAANIEKATSKVEQIVKENLKELTKIETIDKKSIEDVSKYLNLDIKRCLKTLIFKTEKEFVMAIVRGDHEINEIKLKNILNCLELEKASEEEIKKLKLDKGFLGPVKSSLKVIADLEALAVPNHSIGANENNYHYINANYERDWKADLVKDIRLAKEGEKDPYSNSILKKMKGIEVGHVFKLGTKYSKIMNAYFVDENGKNKLIEMGCYGIGVSRLIATIVEQNGDENGIVWPIAVAPYHVNIVIANVNDEKQFKLAEELYSLLQKENIEVTLDDRDVSAGFKFKDSDLIGFPIKVIVGKYTEFNEVEISERKGYSNKIKKDYVLNYIKEILKK